MKIRLAHLSILTFFLSFPALPRAHPHSTKPEIPTDSGYVFALAAANGMVLLSDGLRHSQNADQMEDFFSNAKTKVRSFEITRGHGNPGRYTFPIVLVTPKGNHITRKFSEITLIEAGKNDWVVDKLP